MTTLTSMVVQRMQKASYAETFRSNQYNTAKSLKKEETKLRQQSARENQAWLRRRKQQNQDYLYKTEYLKNAFNRQVNLEYNKMLQEKKKETQKRELQATAINPRALVSKMKPDQLFASVRQRKLNEVKEFHNRPPNTKAKQIIKLLKDMKGPQKAEKPLHDNDRLVNIQIL